MGNKKRKDGLTVRVTEAEIKYDYYIIFIWGDVDPALMGPYKTEEERDRIAREIRKEEGEEHGIYQLDVDKGTEVGLYSYSGAFFEEEVK
jgi:hypothetical protein